MICIEVVKNGWVVTDRFGSKQVFMNKIEYLTRVHQLTCEWRVGDQVIIKREEPKEQP